jgi:parallel beta-helix repeat protein
MITLGLVEAVDDSGVYVVMPGTKGVVRGPFRSLSTVAAGTTVLVASTDDGEQVVVGVAPGGDGVVNVLSFGATGDGVTNDTAAIQAALDAAGSSAVYLPRGTYRVSGVTLSSGQTLQGDGKGQTVLLANVSDTDGISAVGSSGTHLTNVIIRDLTVQGYSSGSNQSCISLDYVDGATIHDVELMSARINGLDIFRSTNVRVDRVDVHDVETFGILCYESIGVTVSNSYVYDLDEAGRGHLGLQFKNCVACKAVGNRFSNIEGYGFYTWTDGLGTDCANITAIGNTFSGIAGTAGGGEFARLSVYIHTTNNVVIAGNHVYDSWGGVAVESSSDVVVSGNRIVGPDDGGSGVSLYQVNRASIADNVISGLPTGVAITGGSDTVTASGNIVTDGVYSSYLYAGIRVWDADNVRVVGNTASDTRGGSAQQRRGISVESSATGVVVAFNTATGNLDADIVMDDTTGITYGNITDLSQTNYLPLGDANSLVGFYGATPAAKPTVTGSRGGNAALASLLTQLAGLGLITDSSS